MNGQDVSDFMGRCLSSLDAYTGVGFISVQYLKREGMHFINTNILE